MSKQHEAINFFYPGLFEDERLDLEQFLFDHLLIEDPYNNYNESDSDEENNISSSIDETNL